MPIPPVEINDLVFVQGKGLFLVSTPLGMGNHDTEMRGIPAVEPYVTDVLSGNSTIRHVGFSIHEVVAVWKSDQLKPQQQELPQQEKRKPGRPRKSPPPPL